MVRDSAFAALVDEFIWQRHRSDPVLATSQGVHEFDAAPTDLSATGVGLREALVDHWLPRFEDLDQYSMTLVERTDRALIVAQLKGERATRHHRFWRKQPSLYSDSIVRGAFHGALREGLPLEERLGLVAERLAAAPATIAAARANLDPSSVPALWCDIALRSLPGGVAFLRGPLVAQAPADSALALDLTASAGAAATALEGYAAWLRDEVVPHAAGSFAIGRDAFDALLRDRELIAHDTETLSAFGLELARETESALVAAAGVLGDSDWRDSVLRLGRDHPSADQLVAAYRTEMERSREATSVCALVGIPTAEPLIVEEMPAFSRPTHPYAAYLGAAPFERSRQGRFWVTLPEPDDTAEATEARLQGHPRAGIPVIACHEGYPGHHLQLTVSADHQSAARRAFRSNVFVEGWGLYVEELMTELGFLASPETRLLRLKDLLWRAARVHVDVGLATGALSVEQAVDYLVDVPKLERPNAVAEVRRYTLTPLQPSSYALGRGLILGLRDKARARFWGMREFHDRLLAVGSLPPRLAAEELGLG